MYIYACVCERRGIYIYIYMCVCVCVCERADRPLGTRGGGGGLRQFNLGHSALK